MALFFVDIESTGVDLKNDRIIQLAVLKVQNEKIEIYDDLCYTDIEMNEEVVNIHNITNEMLKDKYWPYETDSFIELEKGNVASNYFISHGNQLDIQMLENEELILKMKCIDTNKCSLALLKDARSYKLEDLLVQFNLIDRSDILARKIGLTDLKAHDALSDALWHYVLFEFLLEKLSGDVEKLVEITETPMLLEKITFGKHKNKTFDEVMQKSPLDMVWMYVNIAKDWEDLDFTLSYWLKSKEYFWKKALKERKENDFYL